VSEFELPGCLVDSWLIRIKFPWVGIKNKGPVFFQDRLDALLEKIGGIQSEISAAAQWNYFFAYKQDADW
jgi:hypothetical protein